MSKKVRVIFCVVLLVLLVSCSKKNESPVSQTPQQSASAQTAQPTAIPAPLGRRTGDLDEMVKGRTIRALVLINPISFFYVAGKPMGINYEALMEFERFANKKLKTGDLDVKVAFIPVTPGQVEIALQQGVGDFVAAAIVMTPERADRVAFTVPVEKDVSQIIVSGPNFGPATTLEDLSGKEIYVNPVSINYQNLQRVNDTLKLAKKPPLIIKEADENLQDDDLLQMVNAGIIPAMATREPRAKLWAEVLPNLVIHSNLIIDSGEQTAWIVRKNNPELKKLLDEFIAPRAVGTSFGNTLLRRYVQNTKWIKNSTSKEEMKKFEALSGVFKKYASQYKFDYLLVMAQAYQESMLNQSARNPSGAVGIMQVIPKYAAAPPINIRDVNKAEANIHAGLRMLRNIEDQYFNEPGIDEKNKTLFVFASYNAGPNRIARLRKEAKDEGLDPNKWFGNVEYVAAKDIGEETVTYVANVYKYYIAYKMVLEKATSMKQNR